TKLGVIPADGTKLPEVPAIALGTEGMSPLTMANAYATFANRGVYCTPVALESITDAHGKALAVPKSQCDRVMAEKTADTVNTLLLGVIDSGTGTAAGLTDRQNAGKTGTTDSRYNAWFVGYTPNMAGATWVGSGGSKQVSMENITIGGQYYDKVYGGGLPGPIWKQAVSGALEGREAPNFTTVTIPESGIPAGGGRPTPNPNQNPNKPGKPGKPGGDGKPGGRPGGQTAAGATGGATGGNTPTNPFPDISLEPGLIGGPEGP
ncbi:penicillin-binding protein, partial [Streptomyces sp. NRRL S-444]